jgi:RNase P subunit RPR2
MIASLVDVLFGCWHKNLSFPITSRSARRRSEAAGVTGTYVVCLDCGKEFPYDWKSMKVVSARNHEVEAEPEHARAEAA